MSVSSIYELFKATFSRELVYTMHTSLKFVSKLSTFKESHRVIPRVQERKEKWMVRGPILSILIMYFALLVQDFEIPLTLYIFR